MKIVKRFVSILLALVMVFALGTTAFAAAGSITVDNPQKGTDGNYLTYTAYRIFDVVYNTNQDGSAGTHYAYTIKSTSEWFTTVQTYANEQSHGLTLTASASDPTVYVVETDSTKFSAPDFAATLKADVTGKTGGIVLETQSDGTVKKDGLALGYYFVTSSTGALCNLTTTNPNATIHDKNDIPFEKVDDQQSVDVGQTVNYTITGKVPDYTGFTTYTYKITDTMSKGLTFQKDVAVKVGGTDVTSACTITYKPDDNAPTGFELTIPVKNYTIGAAIKVTYSAKVNEKAVAKIEKNHAELTYSNDPTSNTTTTTQPDEETVYSAKILIDKYEKKADENDTTTKLPGAEFVLYKNVTTGTVTTKQYYKWNETDKKVEWVAEGANGAIPADATKKTTDNTGVASFDGLADGTYYLLETKAPAGYNLLKDPVTVAVDGDQGEAVAEVNLTTTAKVANETGSILPSTGGMGTTLFYILGGVLVIGAVVLLVVRRRMRTEK